MAKRSLLYGRLSFILAPQLHCCFYRMRRKQASCYKEKECSSLQVLEEVLLTLNYRVMPLPIFVFYTGANIGFNNIGSLFYSEEHHIFYARMAYYGSPCLIK